MILQTKLTPYRLPLKQPWQSATGSFNHRSGWLIELITDDGYHGYGDSTTLPTGGGETPTQAEHWLRRELKAATNLSPQTALDGLPPPGDSPAARCGIETALLDLISQMADSPLHLWLNPASSSSVQTNTNLGQLNKTVISKAEIAIRQGFHVLKIKVGGSPVKQELQLLEHLAQTLPDSITLRLDANRAWSQTDARHFLRGIDGLPIESLEEPLQQPELIALADLQASSHCKIALDESLQQIDITELLAVQPIHRLILKPMLQGGLLPALQLAQRAKAVGIDSVVTTTVDSAAGSWAATQLAAAIDNQLYNGLATSSWLAQDIGVSPVIEDGVISIPSNAGLGFKPT